MKILIIGDANSIWIRQLIERTILKYGDDVSIVTFSNLKNSEYYKEHNVTVHTLDKNPTFFNRMYFILHNIVLVNKHFDVISVQCARRDFVLLLTLALFSKSRKTISFWGSDILRQKKKSLILGIGLTCADVITFSTQAMIDYFHHLYGYRYDNKIQKTQFGSCVIDKDVITSKHREAIVAQQYKLNTEKTIVSIGYNNSKAQQHIKALDSICNLPVEKRQNIHILLRLTYGGAETDYLKQIEEATIRTGCTYSMITDYVDNETVIELTRLTDVFINAQITDAASASVQEHIYFGALVMNPMWIDYGNLLDGIFYLPYADFDELTEALSNNTIKKNKSPYSAELYANSEVIYDRLSWDNKIEGWRRVFEGK
jgi:hypothetical protein